ncbi:PhzF family phenazine biosynthesis protein [Antarctobacter heliothermus]|uniref:Trans-2,3-dihydro-3-hydroxyanthranilate isomerase n=1 Tax=Antarctobacter heliothermus TaxID=74033 RepID=A0A239DX72_9RHOB|nr:PhzF family phenazine biosynthesis protein [Antarctobacter heliothermus]SNS36293.1 trans-2,3-dihydro-3-hydroxyanthranilate isomerase [Antarctobacter heliothermus]
MTRTVECLSDRLPFVTCDVFTDTAFAGNPLAIVEDADRLSDAAMQIIAREFNLSETIFVRRPVDPAHSASVRIFFPTAEIPFAGHPTIGCAIHLALKSAPLGDFDTVITLEEVAGLVPVRVWRKDGRVAAEFRAPVLPHAVETGQLPDDAAFAAALGLSTAQIGFDTHRPGLWQGGPAFAYAPVCDHDALTAARPNGAAWEALTKATGVNALYIYTKGDGVDLSARMFAPGDGIPEDPATGSASAILAAQLLNAGTLAEGETCLSLLQGADMGRPSRIDLRIVTTGGTLQAVYVSGSAVPISEGHISPPTD